VGDKFLTKNDVCELLLISQKTLDRIVFDGMLPVYKIRGQCRFKSCDVEMYIDACKREHTPAQLLPPVRKRMEKMSSYAPDLPSTYVPGMKVV